MLRHCIALIMSCHHSEVLFFSQAVTVYLLSPLQQTPLALLSVCLSVSLLILSVLQVVITRSHFVQLHRHELSVFLPCLAEVAVPQDFSVFCLLALFLLCPFVHLFLCIDLLPVSSVVLFCQAPYLFHAAVRSASLSFICGD